jgi:hypothetical protein
MPYSSGRYVSEWNTATHFNKTHTNSELKTFVPSTKGGGANTIGNFVRTQTVTTGRVLRIAAVANTTTHTVKNLFVNYLPTTVSPHPTGLYAINSNTVNETNEWYHQEPSATAAPTASLAAFPGVRYIFNVVDIALPNLHRNQEPARLRQPGHRLAQRTVPG